MQENNKKKKSWKNVEPDCAILVDGEGKNQRLNLVFLKWVISGYEFSSEITIINGNIGGDQRGRTGFAGSSSFTEWGLVTVPEFVSFPTRNPTQLSSHQKEDNKKKTM